jgi:hypothetical protein
MRIPCNTIGVTSRNKGNSTGIPGTLALRWNSHRENIMKYALALLAFAATALLSGCAVYEPAGYASYPAPGTYYSYEERGYPGRVYSAPVYAAPVYAAPVYAAPVYVEPPVSFSFGFLFGGHGGHGGGWGHRGWGHHH